MKEKTVKIERSLAVGGMVNSTCFALIAMLQAVLMFNSGIILAVVLNGIASFMAIRDAVRFYEIIQEKQED